LAKQPKKPTRKDKIAAAKAAAKPQTKPKE
jgi:hypothetical protein